jgi:hypothetical protein
MPKRYYLSPIVPYTTPLGGAGYRTRIAQLGINHSAVIPSDLQTGRPTSSWALVLVDAPSFTTLDADTSLAGFEQVELTRTIASLNNPTRTRLRNVLTKFGLSGTLVDQSTTLEDLLRRVCAQLPGYTEQYRDLPR